MHESQFARYHEPERRKNIKKSIGAINKKPPTQLALGGAERKILALDKPSREFRAGDGTPTELADGFGSHCLTLARMRPKMDTQGVTHSPTRIHPTGRFPRGLFLLQEQTFGVRFHRKRCSCEATKTLFPNDRAQQSSFAACIIQDFGFGENRAEVVTAPFAQARAHFRWRTRERRC
jgi:hypothetical protein